MTINGAPSEVTAWSNTAITIRVPSRGSTGNLVVTAGEVVSNGVPFTFDPEPAVTSISETSGVVGSPVTITGDNLLDAGGNGAVAFNGTPTAILSQTGTAITVNVPSGATSGPIRVRVNGVLLIGPDFTVTKVVPQISGISPNYGATAAFINIAGTNFGATQGNGYVTVGGAISEVTAWSNTAITIRVPSGASTGNLVVAAGGEASNGEAFTFYSQPSITSLSPGSGPVGTLLTLTGSNLADGEGNGKVTFNGTPATILSNTETQIVADVPSGATSGRVLVQVNGVTLVATNNFTVTQPVPQISGISPNYGAPAAFINITGSGFGTTQGNSYILVGDALSEVTAWSNTAITVRVPSRASTGNLVVSVGGESSNGAPFTFYGEPSTTSLSPGSGPVGTLVTLTGSNLADGEGNGKVTFNGTPATILSNTETQIVVDVPSGATSGRMLVQVNGVTLTAATDFTVTPPTP